MNPLGLRLRAAVQRAAVPRVTKIGLAAWCLAFRFLEQYHIITRLREAR